MNPIYTDKFSGMNNADSNSALSLSMKQLSVKDAAGGVRMIHNMDVQPSGDLTKREGFTVWQSLIGAHSLFSTGLEFFCVRQGTTTPERLCKIDLSKTITHICDIVGAGDPMFYVQIGTRLFMSSKNWNGVYENGAVRAWGAEYSDDPADYAGAESSEELMLMGDTKAPCMENLTHVGARIFGTVGNKVYYNDPPLAYEMFRKDTFHEFAEPITMIAVAPDGLYFHSTKTSWYAAGYDPENFKFTVVGDGSIPGTLQYLAEFKNTTNVPVWLGDDGVEVGLGGEITSLTQDIIKIDHTEARAASVYTKDKRYLSSMVAPPDAAINDAVTCEVIRNGKLIS